MPSSEDEPELDSSSGLGLNSDFQEWVSSKSNKSRDVQSWQVALNTFKTVQADCKHFMKSPSGLPAITKHIVIDVSDNT
jgi:hypothetical protein